MTKSQFDALQSQLGERGRGVGLGRHSGGGGGLGQEIMNRDGNKNIYLTIYILNFGGKR